MFLFHITPMLLEMLGLSDVAYIIIITDAWPTISVLQLY